jgi:hypothetical protein
MGLGLRNATFALNSELQSGLAWAAQDCTTATIRLAAVRTARSREAQTTWPMCQNEDNSALRGPSML